MLFHARTTAASRVTLSITASDPFMRFWAARPAKTLEAMVRMYVGAAIGPSAAPVRTAHEQVMSIPIKPAAAPSPRGECEAQRYAKSKSNGAAHEKSGPGRTEYDEGIINRNADIGWIHRHDRYIGTAGNHHLPVASQVAVLRGLPPLILHRVHHVLLLRQKGVAQLGRPVHVRSHHLQHGGKRQQRLYTGVPRQAVFGDGSGQF